MIPKIEGEGDTPSVLLKGPKSGIVKQKMRSEIYSCRNPQPYRACRMAAVTRAASTAVFPREIAFFRVRLHFKPDRPHQFEAVALRNYAVSQFVVESHSAVLQLILEMNITQMALGRIADVGQCQVMRAHQPNRAALDQRAHNSLRANAAVFRVCAL